MSFDLFLSCYQNGEPAGIAENLVREAFADAVIHEKNEFSCWRVEFGPDMSFCDIYISKDERSQITSLMVNRPITDERLWTSLFRIMQLGNVVLYFPGGESPLFANQLAIEHFPPEMLAALGKPVVIERGADIVKSIEKA